MIKCATSRADGVLNSCIGLHTGGLTVFLLVLLPLLVYALASVKEPSDSVGWWGRCSQGWPAVYLERQIDNAEPSVWLLWLGVVRFSPLLMVVNIAVACVLALAAAFLWDSYTIRRAWWQMSLKEILCLITVSSLALSYLYLPAFQRWREDALAARLEKTGWVLFGNVPVEPNWIMRPLLDLGILSRDSLWRVRSVSWRGKTSCSAEDVPCHVAPPRPEQAFAGLLDEAARLLKSLKYCDEIHICSGLLTDEGLRALSATWTDCVRADFGNSSRLTDLAVQHIVENWRDLEELDLSRTAISDHGLLILAGLPRLTDLSIASLEGISLDGITTLVQRSGSLRTVVISDDWTIDERFPEFRNEAEQRAVSVIVLSRSEGHGLRS